MIITLIWIAVFFSDDTEPIISPSIVPIPSDDEEGGKPLGPHEILNVLYIVRFKSKCILEYDNVFKAFLGLYLEPIRWPSGMERLLLDR